METSEIIERLKQVEETAEYGRAALIIIVMAILIITGYIIIDLSRENEKNKKRIKELEKEQKNGK